MGFGISKEKGMSTKNNTKFYLFLLSMLLGFFALWASVWFQLGNLTTKIEPIEGIRKDLVEIKERLTKVETLVHDMLKKNQ